MAGAKSVKSSGVLSGMSETIILLGSTIRDTVTEALDPVIRAGNETNTAEVKTDIPTGGSIETTIAAEGTVPAPREERAIKMGGETAWDGKAVQTT
jgi:NAD(P)H-hydrate repair Nnr-like enzyme with NAD(P)H-hydrate epimerase domain